MKKVISLSIVIFSLLTSFAQAQTPTVALSTKDGIIVITATRPSAQGVTNQYAPIISDQPITTIPARYTEYDYKAFLPTETSITWNIPGKTFGKAYHVRLIAKGGSFISADQTILLPTENIYASPIKFKAESSPTISTTGIKNVNNSFTVSGTIDTSKHTPLSIIPLDTITISGRVETVDTKESLVQLGPVSPDNAGVFNIAFSGNNLDQAQYKLVVIYTSTNGGQGGEETLIDVQKGAIVPSSGAGLDAYLKSRSYKLLAPLPGIDAILDPEICQNAKALNPKEICDINDFINFILTFMIGAAAVALVVRLILHGYNYMTTDIPFVQAGAKAGFKDALIGLLVALSSYLILNTINPQLVKNSFNVDKVNFDVEVFSRADDPEFVAELDSYDTTGISVNIDNLSDLHLGYLTHQQGLGGAAAIIWAAKKGYKTVPSDNPYTNANINRNMDANFPKASAQKTIGTQELTPATFLKYWVTKIEAVKKTPSTTIPSFINNDLSKASSETQVSLSDLQVICKIESYKSCTTPESVVHVNKFGFTGLFQLSKNVWGVFGKKGGDIKNSYHNAFAAAEYYKSNLSQIKKKLSN